MALRQLTFSPALESRVQERINALPPVRMTAMQTMAAFMWRPLALMGVMVLFSGAIIAGVNSFRVDEFFGSPDMRQALNLGAADPADQLTFSSIQTWLPGYQFLGMGLLFAAITMVLAAILGRLRVLGGTVQGSLGAPIVFPPFPISARLFPMLMLFGLIVLLTQLGVSAWLATEAKSGDPGALLNVQQHADWLQGMRFAGVGLMLSGIALAMFTITIAMRFMTGRVAEVTAQAVEQD